MSLEILAYESTSLGILCLRRRELLSKPGTIVTEVTLNHEFLMSSYLNESERALAKLGIEKVSAPNRDNLKVLVGGLGLGYTAHECLDSQQVASVEVVEFLPQVISWLEKQLVPLASSLSNNPRLTVTQGDIYSRVTATDPENEFDLIVIDVDHSPQDVLGDQSHGFYTEDGLRKTSAHLKDGGVLGVWSYANDSPLLDQLKKVFAEVDVQEITVWNDLINVEQTDWLFFARKA